MSPNHHASVFEMSINNTFVLFALLLLYKNVELWVENPVLVFIVS